jgi:hypothetical protein
MVHFLYLSKENEPKERTAYHLACGFPALLQSAGSLKTRFAQTGQTPFSADSLLLGCVKWQKNTEKFKFRDPSCPIEYHSCCGNKNSSLRPETRGNSRSVFLLLKPRPLDTLKPKK